MFACKWRAVAFEGMITTRFYLDCRAVGSGQAAPLRLVVTNKSVRAYIPLSVSLLPEQWDAYRQMVVTHPRKVELNNLIQSQKVAVDAIIFRLSQAGELSGLSASKIKERIVGELYPSECVNKATPYSCFVAFMETKSGRTRQLYQVTLGRLLAFCPGFAKLSFEDITVRWLEKFDKFMSETAPSRNARNIHHRNLRTVFNRAIDDEVTHCYPFRKFKIKPQATQKRAMSIEELRKIATAPLPGWQEPYRDMWVLSFCLIGINVADLCMLREIDGAGRIQYIRAKTHKAYSVKVEPEALAIIEKYRGEHWLLYMLDSHKHYRGWYKQLCHGLAAVRDSLNKIDDGIQIHALTSYWARHTWATTAAFLDVPKETIAAALGHGGNTVTDIYIDFDRSKVDNANRRVLDWVFRGVR